MRLFGDNYRNPRGAGLYYIVILRIFGGLSNAFTFKRHCLKIIRRHYTQNGKEERDKKSELCSNSSNHPIAYVIVHCANH